MGLVTLTELPRDGANWTGERVPVGLNPSILDSAEIATLPGYGDSCVMLKMPERIIFCEGEIIDVIEKINEASKVQIHAEKPEHIVSLEPAYYDSGAG